MQTELDVVMNAHINLIRKIATKFYTCEKEDLYQAGAIGVMNAYQNYKASSGTKFSSYAYDYIFGEMYKLATENRSIKVNRDILSLYKKIEQTRFALAQRLGRYPSNEDIAAYLELNPDMVNNCIASAASILSLDAAPSEDSEREMYNLVEDKKATNVDNHIAIKEGMEVLKEDEKKIIEYRYFKDFTQSETAKLLGMTQVMVSRYEKRGLAKMRSTMVS